MRVAGLYLGDISIYIDIKQRLPQSCLYFGYGFKSQIFMTTQDFGDLCRADTHAPRKL